MSDVGTLVAIIGTITAVESALIGTLAWAGGRRAERRRAGEAAAARAAEAQKEAIAAALQPLAATLENLSSKVTDMAQKQGVLTDKLYAQDRQLTETRAQLQVFLTVMARNAADILHSPHPERYHIDRMLEAFKDGTLDEAGKRELKGILEYIVSIPHGQEAQADFPVFEGDKVSAAMLLAYMEMQGGGSELRPAH